MPLDRVDLLLLPLCRLGEEHPALVLAIDRPRGPRRSGISSRVTRGLSTTLRERAHALALMHGATVSMLMHETEGLISFFLNTLVLCAALSGAMRAAAALAQVHTRMPEARAGGHR